MPRRKMIDTSNWMWRRRGLSFSKSSDTSTLDSISEFPVPHSEAAFLASTNFTLVENMRGWNSDMYGRR